MANINALKTETVRVTVTIDELIRSLEQEILMALHIPKDAYINSEGKLAYEATYATSHKWEEEVTVRVATDNDKAVINAFQTIRKIAEENKLV